MGFKKDFSVNILRLTTAIARKGLGHILILDHTQNNPAKVYNALEDVLADFGEADAYQLAKDIFDQEIDEVIIAGKTSEVPTELASELDKLNANQDFVAFVSTNNSDAAITAFSDWVEGKDKLYAVTSASKTITNASDYTAIAYHKTDNLMEKALAYLLSKDAGAVDLDGKPVPYIQDSDITEAEYRVLKKNNINVAIEKFDDLVVDGGNAAGGEKLDIILSEFWIKSNMERDLAKLKAKTPKVPYTDAGIALLIDVVNNRLQMAVEQGIIATDADGMAEYEVSYVPLGEVSQPDRANRTYDGIAWEARLSGAIRTGTISGILTV